MNYTQSVADWDPGKGKTPDMAQNNALLNTEAHDIPENINANNELKEYSNSNGSAGSGPLGPRGHEF